MPRDATPSTHRRTRLLAGIGLVVVTAALWVIALGLLSGCACFNPFGAPS